MNDQRPDGAEQESVAIRTRNGRRGRPVVTPRAGYVIDDDGLTSLRGQIPGDEPRPIIRTAAGRVGDDQMDRLQRVTSDLRTGFLCDRHTGDKYREKRDQHAAKLGLLRSH
jgi:hypothetical protein